ncbi:Possible hemagglutinin (DUF638) [Campylobacter jejuni]|nr:Possible hemagglutinin (DUF638) [Campylobacter jejuni]
MKREDLDETQKQKIVALSTLAGGLAGDDTAGIIAGAQGGKNAVENNVVGCSSRTCPSSLGDDLMRGGGIGGGTTGGAAGAGIGAIIAGMFGDDKSTISDTEGDQIVDQGSTNTGGDQQFDQNGIPTNTGNTESGNTSSNNTGNNDGGIDTGGNTTTTPIAEWNKDDLAYLALKGKEAQAAVSNLGFDRRISPQKAPFNSHGQPVYFVGKTYITPDVDSHNVTNGWKMFDRKGERMGTYDSSLNRIKD